MNFKKNRGLFTGIAFLLIGLGALSLILEMVGRDFGFLLWIESLGLLGSFLVKVGFIIVGFVLLILANTNEEAYDEYFDGDKYDA